MFDSAALFPLQEIRTSGDRDVHVQCVRDKVYL